jgi:hypothetical protein
MKSLIGQCSPLVVRSETLMKHHLVGSIKTQPYAVLFYSTNLQKINIIPIKN